MLEFLEGRGDPSSPTGTLIAFAEVDGRNPIDAEGKFIAVHIVVSPLSALLDHYPVVVFPPASYHDQNELDRMIEFVGHCDVIRLPAFCLPEEGKDDDYIQSRMDDLNKIVEEYFSLIQKRFAALANREGWTISSLELDLEDAEDEIPLDLRSSLSKLERLIERRADYEYYRPVIRYIKSHHPELDVWNLEDLLQRSRLDVASLYVKKFRAIAEERYEAAAFYQTRIQSLEPRGGSGRIGI